MYHISYIHDIYISYIYHIKYIASNFFMVVIAQSIIYLHVFKFTNMLRCQKSNHSIQVIFL